MMMMNPAMMMKNEKVKMTGMEGSGTNWEKIRSQQSDKFSLFVGNLDSMVNEDLLSNFFQKWGRIFSVRVMRAKGKGTSRGFGFVTYYQQEDMKAARLQANGQKILENPIRVVRNVPQPSVFS
jgi:RNA recognition motif-containing protein